MTWWERVWWYYRAKCISVLLLQILKNNECRGRYFLSVKHLNSKMLIITLFSCTKVSAREAEKSVDFDEKIHRRFLKLQQLWFWIGIGQNQKWMCWQMVLLFHRVSAWKEEEVCNVINKSSNNHGGIGAKVSELSEKKEEPWPQNKRFPLFFLRCQRKNLHFPGFFVEIRLQHQREWWCHG